MSDAKAILFDIDGTLVDSNYAHTAAWSKALDELDRPVPSWRIHAAIGMDSSHLLARLLGDDADELGSQATQLHSEFYSQSADSLRPMPGARELIQEVSRRGTRVILATSAPHDELDILLRVLDVDDHIFAITSAEDVETAKPAPDIVAVALDRAEAAASDSIFVGDSIWDVVAANRAGVKCLGLRCGGTGGMELFNAGAFFVWDDPVDVLDHYDETFE